MGALQYKLTRSGAIKVRQSTSLGVVCEDARAVLLADGRAFLRMTWAPQHVLELRLVDGELQYTMPASEPAWMTDAVKIMQRLMS